MTGDEFDAIGQIATGSLIAGTVEPAHGGSGQDDIGAVVGSVTSRLATATCANCAAPVHGNYCAACGQKAGLHRTLTAFWHDLLHGALHFDGKTWRTLPKLAFKPGELTRRYIDGERARFVSPMALFLFSIFLMFAVFQAIGLTAPTQINTKEGIEASLDQIEGQSSAELEAMRERLAKDEMSDDERARIQAELADAEAVVVGLEGARETILEASGPNTMSANITGIDFIDEGIVRKWQENPSLMIYKLQANSYKFSWMLIPLSLPFVWLLFFWKRQFKAYDHAIFVTYSLAFMSLLFVLLSGLSIGGVATPVIVLSAIFIPPIHIYKHLRGTYGIGRLGAFARLMILTVFIIIIVTLFLQLLLVLGAF